MTSKLSNDNVEYKARQHPLTVQGTLPRGPEGVEGEGLEVASPEGMEGEGLEGV